MIVSVPETDSLMVIELPNTEGGKPLYPEPRTSVEVDLDAFYEARSEGLTHGQLLAAALGQPRGTFVNGRVATLEVISGEILKATAS